MQASLDCQVHQPVCEQCCSQQYRPEEDGLLGHQAQLVAVPSQLQIPDVVSIQQYLQAKLESCPLSELLHIHAHMAQMAAGACTAHAWHLHVRMQSPGDASRRGPSIVKAACLHAWTAERLIDSCLRPTRSCTELYITGSAPSHTHKGSDKQVLPGRAWGRRSAAAAG